MRVPLASALVFLSLVGVASAATEQEKRRLHVPSVRSATNCIVEQVRRDLRPNSSAADVSTAINSAMPTCRKGLNRMVDQHDKIYGRGTGRKFLEGPYLHDLARAVSARIESPNSQADAGTEIYTLSGSCTKHLAAEVDRTASCSRVLVNTNWPNGRSGFYFTSDGTALTFSGLGNEQVKPHPDQAVQPIDLVIISQAVQPTDTVIASSVKLKAVGQCEFSNPEYRQSLFSCRAVTESGVFEAAFLSDGNPPRPLDLRACLRSTGLVTANVG
jgi:hypothetical protein